MSAQSETNKRIAKNTMALYIRMLLLLSISLYTSRVMLKELGIENYGIQNVVGGFVSMFGMFSGSLANAISRFITFELGRGDIKKQKLIFSTSINIQLIIGIILVILIEIVGYWFLKFKMNIPEGRESAATWVLHCSALSFLISLLYVPYNASIIAHEKMTAFAYVSIIEALIKLGIIFSLIITPFDKLITYTVLLTFTSIVMFTIYYIYCKHNFEETKYSPHIEKSIFVEMSKFSVWNIFGNVASVFSTQGVNMLINIFFGVTCNAARGIAVQVENAVEQFVINFTMALNPQITKSYARKEYDYLAKLVSMGTKYSFFILYVMVLPIILETETLLTLWLGNYPTDTAVFVRFVFLYSLTCLMGKPLLTAIFATGNIKKYQFYASSIIILVLPLSWTFYKFGAPAYSTYIIYAFLYSILLIYRVCILSKLTNFSKRYFLKNTLIPIVSVGVIGSILPIIEIMLIEKSVFRFFLIVVSSTIWILTIEYIFGLSKSEKDFIKTKVKKINLK